MAFIYTIAQLKDLSALADLQSKFFLGEESIAKALDLSEDLYRKYVTLMLPLSIRRTMTYIALDQARGKIVGLAVDFPQTLSDEELPAFPNEISQFLAQLSTVFKKLERPLKQYATWRKGKCARTMFIGVDKPYRRMGVATALQNYSEENSKKLGFEMLISDAINIKSEKTFLRCGFQAINRVEYKSCGLPGFSRLSGTCTLMLKLLVPQTSEEKSKTVYG